MTKLTLKKLQRHLHTATQILRGKIEASRYRDIILGILFIRRSSDVFQENQEKLIRRLLNKGMDEQEANKIAECPDSYSTIFVPECSRFSYLYSNLNKNVGKGLNRALLILSKSNPELSDLLDHINFTQKVGQHSLSDSELRSLIDHFGKYRMRNEDFEHSDLLGSAYEFLVSRFAESSNKQGGEFYTPRSIVKLMVSLVEPEPGMRVYDPCCGSGGMLIYSKRFIEERGGNGRKLKLFGQEKEGSAWVISKMNLILNDADHTGIAHDDVLINPSHFENGKLMKFDRILSNPPFSMKCDKSNLGYMERFSKFGDVVEVGKKADFLFVLHMLDSLCPGGILATVVPHGILYRRGYDGEIRKQLIEEDAIEAVIGLAGGLFWDTALSPCILVMRRQKDKPKGRKGHVLFINADREYEPGRSYNHLRPEHSEKILWAYNHDKEIPYFSRKVSIKEIRRDGFSLNIRRYVDSSPSPEMQNIRAHLIGGVPKVEVDNSNLICQSHGFDPASLLIGMDKGFYKFSPKVTSKSDISDIIDGHRGIVEKEQTLNRVLDKWWSYHKIRLANLPKTCNPLALRNEFMKSFVQQFYPLGVLDRYSLIGIIATWWDNIEDEIKTISRRGFSELVDGWIEIIKDCLEDMALDRKMLFDPHSHKLVKVLIPDYLHAINQSKTIITKLETKKELLERQLVDDIENEEDGNESIEPIQMIEAECKHLKKKKNIAYKRIQYLLRGPNVKDKGSIAAQEKIGKNTHALKKELIALKRRYATYESCLDELAMKMLPLNNLAQQILEERRKMRALNKQLLTRLQNARGDLNNHSLSVLVQELFLEDIRNVLTNTVSKKRQDIKSIFHTFYDKYALSLNDIEDQRTQTANQFFRFMRELGYV